MVTDTAVKMNAEKLKQLQANVRIGGKGTVRRKKKVVHRTATTDDKKLQSSLKKLSGRQSDLFVQHNPVWKYLGAVSIRYDVPLNQMQI